MNWLIFHHSITKRTIMDILYRILYQIVIKYITYYLHASLKQFILTAVHIIVVYIIIWHREREQPTIIIMHIKMSDGRLKWEVKLIWNHEQERFLSHCYGIWNSQEFKQHIIKRLLFAPWQKIYITILIYIMHSRPLTLFLCVSDVVTNYDNH